ncbi:MAG: hypothetical protein WCK94_00890 [Comamonadaceae bacterium]|jgi:hypothetical protein
MQALRRFFQRIFFFLFAALLLFEEWGWEPLAALFARLARLPLWAALERRILSLSPRSAMLVFGLPVLTLLPVKLLALYLFGQGHTALGLVLLLSAKIGGTAIMARLFQLTQPALMQLAWFAWCYPRWKAWKDAVLAEVRKSSAWRSAQSMKQSVKLWWKSWQR